MFITNNFGTPYPNTFNKIIRKNDSLALFLENHTGLQACTESMTQVGMVSFFSVKLKVSLAHISRRPWLKECRLPVPRPPHRHAFPRPRGPAHCVLRILVGMHTRYRRTGGPWSGWTGWPVRTGRAFERSTPDTLSTQGNASDVLLYALKSPPRGCKCIPPGMAPSANRAKKKVSANLTFDPWFLLLIENIFFLSRRSRSNL